MRVQKLTTVISLLSKVSCNYRLRIKDHDEPETWSKWIIIPSDNYVEIEEQGPYPIAKVEYVEINPLIKVYTGKLVAEMEYDHTEKIINVLKQEGVAFSQVNGVIRIYADQKLPVPPGSSRDGF